MRKRVLFATAVVALFAFSCSGGAKKGVPATVTSLPSTPSAGASQFSPAPASTATTAPSPLDVLATPMTEGAPIPLPERLVLYYYGGRVPIEGQPQPLLRGSQSPTGFRVDNLTATIPHAEGSLFNMVSDPARGRFAVRACLSGRCQLLGPPDPASRSTGFRSDDGGVSWSALGPLPPSSSLVGFALDGRLIALEPSGGETARFFFADDNTAIPAEVGARVSRNGAAGWMAKDGSLVDPSGRLIAGPVRFPTGPAGQKFAVSSRPVVDAVVWVPFPRDSAISGFISDVTADGKLGRTVSWSGFDLGVIARIDADRLLMIRYYPVPEAIGQAFILDMRDGLLQRISGLRDEVDGDTYPLALAVGLFARVKTVGDCLNVRETPALASPSLGCFKDGVLLRLREQTEQTAAGINWLAVETPGGRPGWASGQFLER